MRTVFKIFFKDIKGLGRHFFALAIAIGLCIIPSLYAWFNIYSNQDPYANTSSIKIAVFSEDKGYSINDDEHVNMGEKIVEQLKDNKSLGWQFSKTKDDAIEGVRSGDYYAAIIIGDDFSESLYNFLNNGLKNPSITYYENSKKNAVATKITDTGRSTLQQSINTEFVNVMIGTMLNELNSLAENDVDAVAAVMENLRRINENLDGYDSMIKSLIEGNKKMSDSLTEIRSILPQVQQVINDTVTSAEIADTTIQTALDDVIKKMDEASRSMGEIADKAIEELEKASRFLPTDTDMANKCLLKAKELIEGLGEHNDALLEALEALDRIDGIDLSVVTSLRNAIAGVKALEEMAAELIGESADMIESAPELIAAKYELLKPVLEKCREKLTDIKDAYNNKVVGAIDNLKKSVELSVKSIIESLNNAGNSLNGVERLLLGVSNIMLSTNDSLDMANNTIAVLKERLTELSIKADEIDENEGYKALLTLIEADAKAYAKFLSEPVLVEQKDVYLVTNYGTNVTPFYTTLAIWVGGIVLVALMKVHVDYEDEEIKKASLSQKYFGRLLLFIAMGQIQTAITVLGNIYILKTDCTHPVMFWVVAAVASLVFISFIYSLTLAFGDVGKAIAVVMVVIQIAGSSGTFPIELLPNFFRNIYRYFPFPYSINAMREAISGLYEWDYLIYLAQLMLYGVVALIIGLVIRKPFIKLGHFIERKMKETKMM